MACKERRVVRMVASELPVQLLLAGLQCVLQPGVLLAADLQLLQQSAVLLLQSFTLLPALLQLGRPPGQSLP